VDVMIGYCGYNCHLCAARSEDPAVRQKLVDGWRKIFGHEHYTAENVQCDGCPSDGRIADQDCKARPCARRRGAESCAHCDQFPCDKMKSMMASREVLMLWGYPKTASVTEEEYHLCMRQFESMPNLAKSLVESGRLPSWLGE
jgi:hypothetical protein